MTVEFLNGILAVIPPDFEIRVIGIPCKPIFLDNLEIFDIQISYMKKQVYIFPKAPDLDTSAND